MATNSQVNYQSRPSIASGDGIEVNYNLDRLGLLGVRNWKSVLVQAGYVWRFTTGAIVSAGADIVGSVGGGNGTSIDEDQPDFIVTNSSADWVMIPFDGQIDTVTLDIDADGEYGAAGWFADHSQGYTAAAIATATGTAVVPRNLAGGLTPLGPQTLPSTIAYASVITVDITDPVLQDVLAFHRIQAADTGTATSEKNSSVNAHFDLDYPYIMRGPSTIIGLWGGTAAVAAVASITVAIVPTSFFSQ